MSHQVQVLHLLHRSSISLAPGGLSAGVIAFDTANGWVTGQNPPAIAVTLPSDGSIVVGDWMRFAYATTNIFTSPTYTTWHQITSDDVLNSSDAGSFAMTWPGALPAGLTYFEMFFGRSTDGGATFPTQSPASNVISDTITAPIVKLDSLTASHRGPTLTYTNTDHTIAGIPSGGAYYQCAAATVVAPGNKFTFGVTADVMTGTDGVLFGIYDGVTDMSAGGYGAGSPGIKDSHGYCLYLNISSGNVWVSRYAAGALVSSLSSGAVYTATDTWEAEFDLSAAAGSHSIKVFRNATLVTTFTGLTLTGFTRAFVGVQNANKATFNPGPTFTHTLTSGIVSYG